MKFNVVSVFAIAMGWIATPPVALAQTLVWSIPAHTAQVDPALLPYYP